MKGSVVSVGVRLIVLFMFLVAYLYSLRYFGLKEPFLVAGSMFAILIAFFIFYVGVGKRWVG